MQSVIQTFYKWLLNLFRIWKKQSGPSDFVWLARFRFLFVYSIFKGALLLIAGVLSLRAKVLLPADFNAGLQTWVSIILAISAVILLLMLGLVLASRFKTRSSGIIMLVAADVCTLLAVVYACSLNSPLLLLIVLVFISCTTPFFVERISRYARGLLHSKYELLHVKRERDRLLLQYTQELTNAIQHERSSLRRELHDKLMQELSASLLQVSIIMMRNSANGALQLNAKEATDLEAALRHAVTVARNVMDDLQSAPLEKR